MPTLFVFVFVYKKLSPHCLHFIKQDLNPEKVLSEKRCDLKTFSFC